MNEKEIENFAFAMAHLWMKKVEDPESPIDVIGMISKEAVKRDNFDKTDLYARLISETSFFIFTFSESVSVVKQFLDHIYQPTS